MAMAIIVEHFLKIFFKNNSKKNVSVLATILMILPGYSESADWKVSPILDLIETYSDNVKLASSGKEEGDYVTQVNPGMNLTGTGSHLKLNATYQMRNLFYADAKNQKTTNHFLNSDANAELIDDFLFLDAKSSINQQSTSALVPTTLDNTNITNDRTEVRTYSVSPFIRNKFSSFASSELRYTNSVVDTNAGGLLDSKDDTVSFNLKSGTSFRTVGWGLNYSKQNIDYKTTANDTETEKYSVDLRYLVTSKFSLNGTSGYEKFNYISLNQKPEGPFWSAGFTWAPSKRSNITASKGQRYYGDTYALSASSQLRRTHWNLVYNEDITDTRSQFVIPATLDTASFLDKLWTTTIPDPVARKEYIKTFIAVNGLPASLANPVNLMTNRVFLQKRLQASVAISGARSTVILSAFSSQRDAQTSQTSDSAIFGSNSTTLSDTSKQTGANILWNWKITGRTSSSIGFGYIKNSFPSTNIETENRSINLSLSRIFRPKINGSLAVRRVWQESDAGIGDYRENAITATVHMTF
jgi:uncharacterized protein (PEP-CTERM system associated)